MTAISLSITPLYAGILALMFVGLAVHVIRGRLSKLIGLGTGGDDDMLTRVRMHGNFGEYVPLCLVLMLILELGGTSVLFMHGIGIALVLGRIAHAYGLSKSAGATPYRAFGMVTVFIVLVGGGVRALLLGFGV